MRDADLAEEAAAAAERGRTTDQELWALARLGARVPVYGPLNCVVPRERAAALAERLLACPWPRPDAYAFALAQIARAAGDRERDLDPALRQRVARRLEELPDGARMARWCSSPSRSRPARRLACSTSRCLPVSACAPERAGFLLERGPALTYPWRNASIAGSAQPAGIAEPDHGPGADSGQRRRSSRGLSLLQLRRPLGRPAAAQRRDRVPPLHGHHEHLARGHDQARGPLDTSDPPLVPAAARRGVAVGGAGRGPPAGAQRGPDDRPSQSGGVVRGRALLPRRPRWVVRDRRLRDAAGSSSPSSSSAVRSRRRSRSW